MTETRLCALPGRHTADPPRITDSPALICDHCTDQLDHWLDTIPDLYTLLPAFVEHGTTERNPDANTTKRAVAPAPMRLEIIDLIDQRLGRKWNGTAPADDRRGVLGILLAIASEIVDKRSLTYPPTPDVTDCARFIRRHLDWLTTQDWITEAHQEIRRVHRALSDAVGDYRPRPVGSCYLIPENQDTACDGPLLASVYGTVRCARCGATWNADEVRRIGLNRAQETA